MPHWIFQKVVMRNKFLSWSGLSQKLTKVDKEGGFCQKLMSANYHISMTKIMTFAPLGLFLPFLKGPLNSPKMDILYHIGQSYIFFNFLLSYWTYLPKDMLLFDQNCCFLLSLRTYISINPCWKADVSRGGGIFCQNLTEADRGRGGVKIYQILDDVIICERSIG